jgi:hypothetical protein
LLLASEVVATKSTKAANKQEGDVASAGAERGLRQRSKEPASAPLGRKEVDQLAQSCSSLDRPDPA